MPKEIHTSYVRIQPDGSFLPGKLGKDEVIKWAKEKGPGHFAARVRGEAVLGKWDHTGKLIWGRGRQ